MLSLGDIYRFRTLDAACQRGEELDIEEIQFLTESASDQPGEVALRGFLRGRRLADWVQISEIGPQGLVCRHAPWMEEGQVLEVVLEEGDISYRFKCEVAWTADADDDLDVGLSFVGVPVQLRLGPPPSQEPPGSAADALLERFAA